MRRPPHMGFQNLPDIHARRHTKRVQHHINRGAIRKERHVFLWHNLGNNAFVAVTPRHFIAGLQFAFYRHKNLNHFHGARWQIIAATDFLNLVVKTRLHTVFLCFKLGVQGLDLRRIRIISQRQLPVLTTA